MEARTPPVLLLSSPRTSTAELIARAAAWRGYDVTERAARARGRRVHWYGGPRAAARLAGPLGLGLLEPADDWLTHVPHPSCGAAYGSPPSPRPGRCGNGPS